MADFDVVIVGGGAAGLSAGTALARSCRNVLVVDAGEPRNDPAAHVHNLFTRDGAAPRDLYATGAEEVRCYGGQVVSGRVSRLARDGAHVMVSYDDRTVTARRLLVATGLRDVLPAVPGLAERWGVDVLHCPYCHGYEVRGQRVGVLVTGPMAVHQALLFRQITEDVTVLTHAGPAPADDPAEQLAARGIRVVDGEVAGLEVADGRLTGVRLAEGRTVPLDALVVAPRMEARAELLADLGLRPVEVRIGEHVVGTRIEAEPSGATVVPGVWVAGNVADVQAQVVSSAAAGLTAAAQINADLVAEDTARAVERMRAGLVVGEAAWEHRYRSHPQHWSGDPNPVLVAEVADLEPGTALDAGAGEGGDARWLARRGWRVTAVDVSPTAVRRGAAATAADGLEVEWRQVDLAREAIEGTYDLVTAHYLHLPAAARRAAFGRLAAAVAPGGTLLVVGHDLADLDTPVPRPGLREMGWTPQDIVVDLGAEWTVEVAESRSRTVTHDGHPTTLHDAVLRATRAVVRPGSGVLPARSRSGSAIRGR